MLADLRSVFEQLPSGVVLFDANLGVVDCNERLLELIGTTRDRVLGRNLASLPDLAFLPCIRSALAGDAAHYEGPYRTVAGRDLAISVRASPLRDADGKTTGGVAIVDLYATTGDDALASRIRKQLDSAPMPSYTWRKRPDGSLALVDHNHAATTATQGRIASLLGKSATEVYGQGSPVEADLRKCLQSGSFTRPDVAYKLVTTGETKRLTLTYVALSEDTCIAYTEDFTLRRRLEEQLRQAQKMDALGQLAAGIAHDFNNMVAAIEDCTAVLAVALGPDSPHLREVDEIRQAGARAAALTRQLLALRKKEAPPKGSVHVGEVAAGVHAMLRRLIPDSIAIVVRADDALYRVAADPIQIEQLVVNLALNARDAMPQGGTLTIESKNVIVDRETSTRLGLAAMGECVELSVTDTGIGMTAKTRERAFEPFFTTKGPSRGTGLGLSTVYGIVHQSEGHVTIESELGRGTTVRVVLPRSTRPEPRAGANSKTEPPRALGRVLLVEDTAPVRRACRRTLTSIGIEVLEAASDEDALHVEAAMAGELDLLLSDVNIPMHGGRSLYERMRLKRPGLRVLYMSGHTLDDMLRRGALEAGAPFLQKPFTFADLVGAVREALAPAVEARVPDPEP